mgnify:CR=1 FL=1
MRPVVQTCERTVQRCVMKRVVETVNRERCYTVMRPVTTYRTVRRDCGRWTVQRTYRPGPMMPRCVRDACGRPRICMVQCPGRYVCRRVWCPNIVEQQIPCTRMCPQVVRKVCPVQVCRMVPTTVTCKIPYRVCRYVCEEQVCKVPVRTCRYVCETVTNRIPVRTCRMVCEEKVCKVPVRTCRMVQEVKTCRGPYCVEKRVPYTVNRTVTRCVAKCVPQTCTRMVARCVPRQVAYEVCRVVPTTICPSATCSTGDCSSGNCATQSTPAAADNAPSTFEAQRPAAQPVPDTKLETESAP